MSEKSRDLRDKLSIDLLALSSLEKIDKKV